MDCCDSGEAGRSGKVKGRERFSELVRSALEVKPGSSTSETFFLQRLTAKTV